MMSSTRTVAKTAATAQMLKTQPMRQLATHAPKPAKKEGDISSVFVSLSGTAPVALPPRFADIKRQLLNGNENAVRASWQKLLERLAVENEEVAQKGPDVIPQIEFKDLASASTEFINEVKKRGSAVIKGVVPEAEARAYKFNVEEYVKENPWTKGKFKHPLNIARNLLII